MNTVWLVARREIMTLLGRRSFYATALIPPLIAGALLFGFSYLRDEIGDDTGGETLNAPAQPAGYVDQAGVIQTVPEELSGFLARFASETDATAALRTNSIGSYFVLGPDYLQTGRVVRVSPQVSFTGGDGVDARAFEAVLRANLAGNPALAQRLQQPLDLESSVVRTAQGPAEAAPEGDNLSMLLAILLAFSIVTGGGWLVQAVAEEKENRTIELVLTSLRPWQLMAGKLIGLGAIALLQLCTWMVIAQLMGSAAPAVGSVELQAAGADAWIWMLVFFVLGFLLFGGLMMALGAVGASAREAGQITGFMTMPVVVPLWFGSLITESPDSMLARVLSLFPLTAPVTMMLRMGQGAVPFWQLLLSAALMFAGVLGAIWLAARLFRGTTLLTGARPTPRALWRALREA